MFNKMEGSTRGDGAAAVNNCCPATTFCAGTRVSTLAAALGILRRLPEVYNLPGVPEDKEYNFHYQK